MNIVTQQYGYIKKHNVVCSTLSQMIYIQFLYDLLPGHQCNMLTKLKIDFFSPIQASWWSACCGQSSNSLCVLVHQWQLAEKNIKLNFQNASSANSIFIFNFSPSGLLQLLT